MKFALSNLVIILAVLCNTVFAQSQQQNLPPISPPGTGQITPSQMQANPIVGVWQTTIQLGEGLPESTGIFYAFPNGNYREEMYVNKKLGAFWEGKYTLTADGTLTQTAEKKSPQICISEGQCMANVDMPQTVGKVTIQNPNQITISVQDQTTGQATNIVYKRMEMPQTEPVIPTVNVPAIPTPSDTPTIPSTTTGTATLTSANPLAPWTGTFTDGDLSVHLGDPKGDYMVHGDAQFSLNVQGVQGNATSKTGEFRTASGDSFTIVLELQNNTLIVTTGGNRFELLKDNTPINPLGN